MYFSAAHMHICMQRIVIGAIMFHNHKPNGLGGDSLFHLPIASAAVTSAGTAASTATAASTTTGSTATAAAASSTTAAAALARPARRHLDADASAAAAGTVQAAGCVFSVASVLELNKGESRRVAGDPDVAQGAVLAECVLNLVLGGRGAQVANVDLAGQIPLPVAWHLVLVVYVLLVRCRCS